MFLSINCQNSSNLINHLLDNDIFIYNEIASTTYSFNTNFKNQFYILVSLLTIILLIISSSIFLIWLTNIIKDIYKEIAIMKSLGFNNKEIFLSFLSIIGLISIICSILGVAIGFIFVLSIKNIIAGINVNIIGYDILMFTYNPLALTICLLMFLVFPLIISFILIYRINKIEPYAALKEFR